MKLKNLFITTCIALTPLALFWGCNKAGQPVAPANGSSLNVSLSGKSASLLLASQNTLLYVVSGPGVPSVSGILGPVSSSSLSGGYSFSISLSSLKYNLISLELENAVGLQAMDIGAMALSGSSNASVTMGPLNKIYYSVSSLSAGYGYGFENNTLTNVGVGTSTTVSGIDVVSNLTSTSLGYELDDPALTNSTVAYMGNGNFVNYLTVPPSASFNSSSSLSKKTVLGGSLLPVAAGDVYCIKMKAGGYAWLQITDAGIVGISGPSFVFRVNTTLPYCGYEQTTADLGGSAVNGTPTPYAPLASFTGFTGNAYGIAVYPSTASATSVFVSDAAAASPGYVRSFNASSTPGPVGTGVTFPKGIAIDSSGATLYVADQGTGNISMFLSSGLTSFGAISAAGPAPTPDSSIYASRGQMVSPQYVAVSPLSGNLFVTDSGTNGVADVMVMSAPISAYAVTIGTFWNGQILNSPGPAGIAIDGTTVYVADSGHNQIETYTLNGVSGSTWTTDNNPAGATAFSAPQGIALNAAEGLIFIADTNNNRVVEMTTTGLFKATWGTWGLGASTAPATLFSGPTAIAVDGATPPNVYVADSGNKRVLEFKAF